MTGPRPHLPTASSDIWQCISDGIEQGGDRVVRSHLAAGFPVYYLQVDTPAEAVIREGPDGSRSLVRFDADGEHIIGRLPPVEPRI